MTTIRSFMTDDHRHCDDLFAEAEQAIAKNNLPAAKASYGHFRKSVLAHFDTEEKTLFPTFEAKTGMSMGPTQVMRMEHAQMRQLFAHLKMVLARQDDHACLDLLDTLLILMQQHNFKEEQMLYQMADDALEDQLDSVIDRLNAVH